MAKELRLSLRIRNNRLISAREALGLKAREAAERIPVSYQTLLRLEGLTMSPIGAKGGWSKSAVRVATFYGSPPGHFWPDAVLAVVEPSRTVQADVMDVARFLPGGNAMALPSEVDLEEQIAEHESVESVMSDVSKLLTPQEQDVLSRRFGLGDRDEETLEDVGASHGLSRERVRQIEARAVAKLRGARNKDGDPRIPREEVVEKLRKAGKAICPRCAKPFDLAVAQPHGWRDPAGVHRTCSNACALFIAPRLTSASTLEQDRAALREAKPPNRWYG